MFKTTTLLFFCCLGFTQAWAQPPNDSLAHRIALISEDAPFPSTTVGATVEWACVDESLTGKCIEYHNDQWFSFTPAHPGPYYLNLGNQACRDVYGVQVVVLTGTPCDPSTYQILHCYSTGYQADIYLTLDSLQAGLEYLINVDGYLQDYCSFTIQISETPHGRPALPRREPGELRSEATGNWVLLRWKLPQALGAEVEGFEVERRNMHQGKVEATLPVGIASNSVGVVARDYFLVDSLPSGSHYEYQIWAQRTNQESVLLGTQRLKIPNSRFTWTVLLHYPGHSFVRLLLYHGQTGALLDDNYYPLEGGVALWQYRPQGAGLLQLQVQDMSGNLLDEHLYMPQR